VVKPLGDQLLAGAALADDQDRPVKRGGAARPLDRIEKGQALPDKLIGPLHAPILGGKSHLLARYFAKIVGRFWLFSRFSVGSW